MTREFHEEMAVLSAKRAANDLVWTRNCNTEAVYALVRANRNIAHARSHLASIGFGPSGPRTRRLWSFVGKRERQIDDANNRVAKCLLKKG